MNAPTTRTTSSSEARNLRWLLDNLVDEVPGVRSVAVVSSDGLLLHGASPGPLGPGDSSEPDESPEPEGPGSGEDGLRGGPGAGAGGAGTHAGAGAGSGTGAGAAPPPVRAQAPDKGGPRGSSADLATIVSGVGSLTIGAARLMDGGSVRQTMISMDEGSLFVMTIGDGSLLGVHAAPDCDMSVIGYHMALFVGRAGHVLTPELRSELRESMELEQ